MKTVVSLYMQAESADKAVRALGAAGFSASSIRVLQGSRAMVRHLGCRSRALLLQDFAAGAALGVGLYGCFGLLVAAGELLLGFERADAISAMLIFVLMGIFAGGLLGLFFGIGSTAGENRRFAAGVRRGGVLIVVSTADEHAARALELLRSTDAEAVRLCVRGRDSAPQCMMASAEERLSRWLRGSARLLGLALIVLALHHFAGGSLPGLEARDALAATPGGDLARLALMLALSGVIVGWRWEAIGAILIVGSVMLLEAIGAIVRGAWQIGLLDPLLLLVALLLLWHWWRHEGACDGRAGRGLP